MWIKERKVIRVIRVVRSEVLKEEFANYVAAYGPSTEGEKMGVIPTPVPQPQGKNEGDCKYQGKLTVSIESEKDTARRLKKYPPPKRPERRAKLG